MLCLRQEQQTSEPAAHLPGLAPGVPGGRVSSAVLPLPSTCRIGAGLCCPHGLEVCWQLSAMVVKEHKNERWGKRSDHTLSWDGGAGAQGKAPRGDS